MGPAWRQRRLSGNRQSGQAGAGSRREGRGLLGWAGLTELLDGTVCTPGQLQCYVDPAPLVLDPAVSLEGDAGAGGLRDDGHELRGQRWGGWVGRAATRSSSSSQPMHWFTLIH